MPPSRFYVRLQCGITGGFAPPTPSEVHELTAADSSSIAIQSMVRPIGTPHLRPASRKNVSLTGSAASDGTTALVDELHGILKQLPLEDPQGSQDIYGLDTSITWGSDDLEWANGGPQGCSGGTSTVQATEGEKAKFKRAVEIVKELVATES
jgi:hypothetical protein